MEIFALAALAKYRQWWDEHMVGFFVITPTHHRLITLASLEFFKDEREGARYTAGWRIAMSLTQKTQRNVVYAFVDSPILN